MDWRDQINEHFLSDYIMNNQEENIETQETQGIQQSNDTDTLWSLSMQQKQRWDLHQFSRAANTSQLLIKLQLDAIKGVDLSSLLGVLKQACEQVITQHEVFSLAFERNVALRYPQQSMGHSLHIKFTEHDSALHQIKNTALLETVLSEAEQRVAINPRSILLLRQHENNSADESSVNDVYIDLIVNNEAQYLSHVLISVSALVCDGQSLSILWSQISERYLVLTEQLVAKVTDEEATQYLNFIAWQEDTISGEDAEEAQSYWAAQQMPTVALADYLPASARSVADYLKSDDSKNAVENLCTEQLTCKVNSSLVPEERESLLLSVWLGLQSRLDTTEQTSCLVQLDMRDEYEELALAQGRYSQWLPISAEVTEQTTFRELHAWLAGALDGHKAWLDFFQPEHAQSALANAQEYRAQWRFNYLDMTQWPDMLGEPEFMVGDTPPGSITLYCLDYGQQVKLILIWDQRSLPEHLANHVLPAFERLLISWQNAPEQTIQQQELLLISLLDDSNKAIQTCVNRTSIVASFVATAQEHPQRTALVFSGNDEKERVTLSYKQLDEYTNQIAQALHKKLKQKGVLSGELTAKPAVAICLPRSADMIIALLSCMKAGLPYIPLDPNQHVQRLNHLIKHTCAAVLIIDPAESKDTVTIDEQYSGICTDLPSLLITTGGAEPYSMPTPVDTDIAYVIYTSGSTGEPKAVAITYDNLHHYTNAITAHLALAPGLSYVSVSTLNADLGNTSIFSSLSKAGTLHIVDQDLAGHGEQFCHYLQDEKIDVLKIVPSHYQALRSSIKESQVLLPATALVLGGEAFTIELAEQLNKDIVQSHSACRIYNHYGPTEATIGCFWFDFKAKEQALFCPTDQRECHTVPIGVPIGDNTLIIIDKNGNHVLPGCAGELCICGPGLSCGYLGSDAQTELNNKKSFASLSNAHGYTQRYYHTGDRVKLLNSGDIEFIGRMDEQIKLRGYRIELNAVRQSLVEHSDIMSAVVLVDRAINQQLIAYCVAENTFIEQGSAQRASHTDVSSLQQNEEQRVEALTAYMHERLPYYMVPAKFIFLDKMPLTPNGKPDTKRLVQISIELENTNKETYLPVQTPTEQALADIWQVLLKNAVIGRNSHFFEIGGHSLLATQFVFRANQTFDIELSLGQIFDTPVLSDLALIIEQQKESSAKVTATRTAILPLTTFENTPLSFSQQRLWFMQQLAPDSASYNVPAIIELNGTVNCDALTMAFDHLLVRHNGLLSRFELVDGEATLAAQSHSPIALLVHKAEDHRSKNNEQWQRWIDEDIDSLVRQPFNLTNEPLIRIALYEVSAQSYRLVVVMHHIICDGWSRDILIDELALAYSALIQGETPSWKALTINYRDYAVWQHQQREGVLADQLDYWVDYLGDDHAPLQMQARLKRPARQRFNGKSVRFTLPQSLTDSLRTLANEQQSTLFTLILSAYHVLLLRYSNQANVRIGIPVAGRNQSGLENLVGLVTNTLVTTSSQEINPNTEGTNKVTSVSFNDFVNTMRQDMRQALEHQDVPFEMLVEKLQPVRSLTHSPLFQAFFSLQPMRDNQRMLGNLEMNLQSADVKASKFDLSLMIEEPQIGMNEACGLSAVLEYDSDLFCEEWVLRLVNNFEILLNDICLHSQYPINQLRLLSGTEQTELLAFNSLPQSLNQFYDNDSSNEKNEFSLLSSLAQRMSLTPEHIAVEVDGQTWTWSEASDRITAISDYIHNRGVTAGQRVVLHLERSADVVFSMLAILRCGACFVPLDPVLPDERKHYIIKQCKADLILTDTQADHVKFESNVSCGALNEVTQQTGYWLNYIAIDNNAPAYILYTSGSTGKPKGVEISLKALDVLLYAMQEKLTLTTSDQWLAITSISFDISLLEMLLPLCTGARLVIATAPQSKDPEQLIELLNEHPISVMQATPGAWRQLLDCAWQAKRPMTLLSGGEALVPSLAADLLPNAELLFNVYGPTEATIWACCKEITSAGDVNLGRPLLNYQCYVVNDALQLQPVESAGQLVIAGDGLAQGYFDQSGLTNRHFITPSSDLRLPYSGRIYLTGDIASYDQYGELHYSGRCDDQVKWRGYRIEPDEIARTLETISAISAAFVMLCDEQLIAFYIYHTEYKNKALSQDIIIGELKQWLPLYMLPSKLVKLDQLPLTSAGKVDRKALRKQSVSVQQDESGLGTELTKASREPNDIEQQIIELWKPLLPGSTINVDDDFFALGGHSLLLTRLLLSLRELFTCELPLHMLFDASTVEQQALAIHQIIEKSEGELSDYPLVGDLYAASPLSYAQQRLWFLDQFMRDSGENTAAYHIPVAARLSGTLDISRLQHALSQLLKQHSQLQTRICASDSTMGQQENIHVSQLLDLQAQLTLQQVKVASTPELALAELISRPIDLSQAPLMRAWLVESEIASTAPVLLLVIHHIIADGWSLQLLIKDLFDNYEKVAETRSQPQFLQVDNEHNDVKANYAYSDYARWQQSLSQKQAQATQLAYWQTYLQGDLPVLNLPTDNPRPKVQQYTGAMLRCALSEHTSQAINAIAKQQKCSRFVVMMSAWALLLNRYSGQQEICIGTPVANRHIPGSETIFGLFANTQVYRCKINAAHTLSALINTVRTDSIAAQKYQDLPFEKLVETLAPERDTSRSPIFQTLLTVQEWANQTHTHIDGLDVHFISQEHSHAKFDVSMAVNVNEQGNLNLAFEYNTSLFNENTAQQMLSSFEALLSNLEDDQNLRDCDVTSVINSPLKDVSVLSSEQALHLDTVNETMIEYPAAESLVVDLTNRVLQNPNAIAVIMDPTFSHQSTGNFQQLTYSELAALSDCLALKIRQKSAPQHNPVVAVMMDRSLEMVVALLAIVKAGAAYLPLNPELPAERIAYMISNANSSLGICQSHYMSAVQQALKDFIVLDECSTLLQSADEMGTLEQVAHELNTYPTVCSDDIAYVMYTSGTTGNPKGVEVPHQGLRNRILWQQSLIQLSSSDKVLQKTPYSFDVSVWEFFWPIMSGATLVVAAPQAHRDPDALITLIKEQKISVLHFVPSMLQVFMDGINANKNNALNSIRALLCSGEVLALPLAKKVITTLPQLDLYNLYGPTEASIDVSYWHCNKLIEADWNSYTVPIGKPIANTQLYILDEHLKRLPLGAAGELYIAGTGLAKGYINQQALTNERFIDVNIDNQTIRMYRTGDLARWINTPNSLLLDYLGRTDNQVKLRGQRLELSEIEAVMLQHPMLDQVTVLAVPEKSPERLVACVVSKAEHDNSFIETLADFMSEKLPSWMVPTHFITVPKFDVTSNGKTDRKALYKYTFKQLASEKKPQSEGRVASNPLEQALCHCIAKLLDRDQVFMDDELFSLGAHSLWMVQLQQAIRREFGVQLALTDLFTHSKIESLIKLLYQSGLDSQCNTVRNVTVADEHILPLATADISDGAVPTLWCVHPASGYAGPFATLASALSEHCNVMGINAAMALEQGKYANAGSNDSASVIEHIAQDYVERIQTQQPQGPYYLAGWSLGGHIATAMTEILEQAGHTVGWLGIIDSILTPIKTASNTKSTVSLNINAQRQKKYDFYQQSLRLMGGKVFTPIQKNALNGLIMEATTQSKNQPLLDDIRLIKQLDNRVFKDDLCAWLLAENLLPSGIKTAKLIAMLNLLEEGQQLVTEQNTDWQQRINAPVDFYWATETLIAAGDFAASIHLYSANISTDCVAQYQIKSDHQGIIVSDDLAIEVGKQLSYRLNINKKINENKEQHESKKELSYDA